MELVLLPSVYPELQMGQPSLMAGCELPPQQDLPVERFPAAAPKICPLENTFPHLLQVSIHVTFKLFSYVASLPYRKEQRWLLFLFQASPETCSFYLSSFSVYVFSAYGYKAQCNLVSYVCTCRPWVLLSKWQEWRKTFMEINSTYLTKYYFSSWTPIVTSDKN